MEVSDLEMVMTVAAPIDCHDGDCREDITHEPNLMTSPGGNERHHIEDDQARE